MQKQTVSDDIIRIPRNPELSSTQRPTVKENDEKKIFENKKTPIINGNSFPDIN